MRDELALVIGALESNVNLTSGDRARLVLGQKKRKRECSDLSLYPNVKQSLIKRYDRRHLDVVTDEFNTDSLVAMEGKWSTIMTSLTVGMPRTFLCLEKGLT